MLLDVTVSLNLYSLQSTMDYNGLEVSIQQDNYIRFGDNLFSYFHQTNAKQFARKDNLPEDVGV